MQLSDIPKITKLSVSEKIILLEDLWDSIVSEESNIPILQSHINELNKRLERYQSSPDDFLSLEELKTRIDNRK